MCHLGGYALQDTHPKLLFNPNLAKCRFPMNYQSIIQSFWNFVQSTALIVSCSTHQLETIGQLKQMLRVNEILRNLSLRWVPYGYPILRRTPSGLFHWRFVSYPEILSKFLCCGNRTSYENFKLKFCTCAQSHALGTRTKLQLEILTINPISDIAYFREIILESS